MPQYLDEKYETTAQAVADLTREIADVAVQLGRAEIRNATDAQRSALASASADVARAALTLGLVFPIGGV